MASHSSDLAWRIPGMGEPGGLPSMGSHRVGHDWSDLAAAALFCGLVQFSCSCEALAVKPCWPSKPGALGAPPSAIRASGWRTWLGAQSSNSCGRTSAMWLISSLWIVHLVCMGFDYIASTPFLPSCFCLFFISLDVEYLFWPLSVFFIDGSSAVFCVCILLRGGEPELFLLHHLGWARRSFISHHFTFFKKNFFNWSTVELFQILKDDAVKVLHSICQQIWKTQQWPQDWKRSVFIPMPKNAQTTTQLHSSHTLVK